MNRTAAKVDSPVETTSTVEKEKAAVLEILSDEPQRKPIRTSKATHELEPIFVDGDTPWNKILSEEFDVYQMEERPLPPALRRMRNVKPSRRRLLIKNSKRAFNFSKFRSSLLTPYLPQRFENREDEVKDEEEEDEDEDLEADLELD